MMFMTRAREIVGEHVQRHLVWRTRGSVFIRKWVAPIRALIVPKGCSTVSRPLAHSLRGSHTEPLSALASTTCSCSHS